MSASEGVLRLPSRQARTRSARGWLKAFCKWAGGVRMPGGERA